MKEQEHIDVSDLAKIRSAKSNLRDVMPEISNVVDKEGYTIIMQTLVSWENKLNDVIDVE